MYEKFREDWKADEAGGTPLVDTALDHFEEGIYQAHVIAGDAADTAQWDRVEGKPASFPPAEHTHSYNDLSDTPEIPAAPTWDNIDGKPAVVASGVNAEGARASIGAGTSDQELSTGSAEQLEAGTDEQAQAWTAKAIHDEVARQVAAALAPAE